MAAPVDRSARGRHGADRADAGEPLPLPTASARPDRPTATRAPEGGEASGWDAKSPTRPRRGHPYRSYLRGPRRLRSMAGRSTREEVAGCTFGGHSSGARPSWTTSRGRWRPARASCSRERQAWASPGSSPRRSSGPSTAGMRVLTVRADPVVRCRAPRRLRPAAARRRRRRVPGRGAGGHPGARARHPRHRRRPRTRRSLGGTGPPARDPGRRAGAGDRAAGRGRPRCHRRSVEGRALCERLDLEPLTPRRALDRLVIEALGGPVDGQFQHLLWSRTLGNVLFARELLAAAVEGGALVARSGIWTLTGPFTAPPRLARADRRPAPGRAARRADRPRPSRPRGTSARRRPAGDRRRTDAREPRGARAPRPRRSARADARLSHPLLADVLLDALGPIRRRRLLRDLVTAVSARPLPGRRRRPRRPLAHRRGPGRVRRRAADHGAALRPRGRAAGRVARPPGPGGRRRGQHGRHHRRWPRSWRSPAARTRLRPSWAACRPARPASSCRREVDLALVLAFGLNRSRDAAERLERLLDEIDDSEWGYRRRPDPAHVAARGRDPPGSPGGRGRPRRRAVVGDATG